MEPPSRDLTFLLNIYIGTTYYKNIYTFCAIYRHSISIAIAWKYNYIKRLEKKIEH